MKRMAASWRWPAGEAGNPRPMQNAVPRVACRYRDGCAGSPKCRWSSSRAFRSDREIDPLRSMLHQAERNTPLRNLGKLTVLRKGKHVFRDQKPEQYHVSTKEAKQAVASLLAYEHTLLPERARFFARYQVEDVAFRVVGTGSVGLRDYVLLMFGGGAVSDPLFIQIKEEPGSVYAQYLPHSPVAAHQGQRVADGGRAMQMQSDIFLGWTSIGSREYVVRQLRDHKASIEAEDLKGTGWWSMRRCAASCSPKGTHVPAIPVLSRAIWALAISSTAPWPLSAWFMRTKPSRTGKN